MKPVNQIVRGDTLEVLKTFDSEWIDLGVTSPPYNKGLKGGPIVKKVEYDEFTDNLPEEEYQQQQVEILDQLWRITKPGGSFFYNHRCRWDDGNMIHPISWLSKTKWLVKQEIIWNRKITGNLRGWRFWQTDERVYWLYKPLGNNRVGVELESKHARMTGIWEIMPENNNPHPAPFPIDLVTRIIYSIFGEQGAGKIVIDPYMGSGTTAVCSKLLGCDWVGIDISQNYIEMANERISNYLDYSPKFRDEIQKHVITGKTYAQRKKEKALKKSLEEGSPRDENPQNGA
ncbi:site-specific DNA-methyltransferase [bacterium]|nr:site-specific DNA-methyltransferase [Candidatus Elulimicrobium humile]